MYLKKSRIGLITVVSIVALAASAFGQPAIEMNFQGKLTDAEGNAITNEHFDLNVKLMSAQQGETELWSSTSVQQTDGEGWFSFTVPDVSSYLMTEEEIKDALVISMEFVPNEKTKWLKQGQDFMVSYTLSPTLKDDAIYLKMTRMEGSELTNLLQENLYMFKDDYPFAYLTGGFLLTDNPPLGEESMDGLRQWIFPDPDAGNSTRGVKGGFPKAGYSRKR
jgi:hypothetical protein